MIEESIYKDLDSLHQKMFNYLEENKEQVPYRQVSIPRKYRGDLHNDVSITINEEGRKLEIRLFLKNKKMYINHLLELENDELDTIYLIKKNYEE